MLRWTVVCINGGKDNVFFYGFINNQSFFSIQKRNFFASLKKKIMTINEAYVIYFSPTHTSKQVAEAIVRGTGIEKEKLIDITRQAAADLVIPATALLHRCSGHGGDQHRLAHESLAKLAFKEPICPMLSTCESPSQAPLCHYTLRTVTDRPEGTFRSLRYTFGGDHPSQTTHQAMSSSPGVRIQTNKGSYFNSGSTDTGVPASKPPTYPTHRVPKFNAKL